MTTSLSSQLERLKAPAATVLSAGKTTSSIIFDVKEAASKDRRTIYELGLRGLEELIVINPMFEQFRTTLFDGATIDFERSVELVEVNQLLDANIEKFLQHLSPYFLLRPTLMCLEWLVRRFRVHDFNQSALMGLSLPYHDSNTFVRVMQTISLRKNDTLWIWLRSSQKLGLPIPKNHLINRASSDVTFLEFVCRVTMDTVRALEKTPNLLQTQLNFYVTLVVGVLSKCEQTVNEKIIRAILPCLLQGLRSSILDFACGSYIIASQLVMKTQLTAKLCRALVGRVVVIQESSNVPQTAYVLLLISLTDTQIVPFTEYITEEICVKLAESKWFLDVLITLASENVNICSLCMCLIAQGTAAIQGNSLHVTMLQQFLEQLLVRIRFTSSTAQMLLSTFLDAFVAPAPEEEHKKIKKANDTEIINLDDSDDDEIYDTNDFQKWYSSYLDRFERLYPNEFDSLIKNDLSGSELHENRAKAIRIGLGFRLKYFGKNSVNLYVSLNHHSAVMRQTAVKELVKNYSKYRRTHAENFKLLQEWLAQRLRIDQNAIVVNEILQMPTKNLIDVLGGNESCINYLIECLYKSKNSIGDENWNAVRSQTVQHLTTDVIVENSHICALQFAVLSLLLADDDSFTRKNIELILQSKLKQRIKWLQSLSIDDIYKEKDYKEKIVHALSQCGHNESLNIHELLEYVETKMPFMLTSSQQFGHFLLMLTISGKSSLTPSISIEIFGKIWKWCEPFKLQNQCNNKKKLIDDKSEAIPLQLFADFIDTLITHTNFIELNHWEQTEVDSLKCFNQIFNVLCVQGSIDSKEISKAWLKLTTNIFHIVCKTKHEMIDLLCNYYAYSSLPYEENNFLLLRITAMRLMIAILNRNEPQASLSLKHLIRICIALCDPSALVRNQAIQTLRIISDNRAMEKDFLNVFVDRLIERNEEICMDADQMPLVLFTILTTTTKSNDRRPQQLKDVLRQILDLINSNEFQQYPRLMAQILKMIQHIDDESTLKRLLPLLSYVLSRCSKKEDGSVSVMLQPMSCIYEMIIIRLNCNTIPKLLNRLTGKDNNIAWQMICQSFAHSQILWSGNNKTKVYPLPCVLLDAWNEDVFECMPKTYQTELIKVIVTSLAAAENDAIFNCVNKFLKKCAIDCKPLVEILQGMSMCQEEQQPVLVQKKRKRLDTEEDNSNAKQYNRNASAWKEGIALLELLENKRRLSNSHLLLPSLFLVLKTILETDEQAEMEYVKQLTLSSILGCMQAVSKEDVINQLPKAAIHIDQIVQCLRSTNNPLTQHNSLMLLCQCAGIYPQEVLYKIVDIFTFVGSATVRQDDAHSLHIIDTIIETIIPILIESQAHNADIMTDDHEIDEEPSGIVIAVLKVFSDIILDVPEHRRLTLYTKLLNTINAQRYFWVFACIVLEAHILAEEKHKSLSYNKSKTVIASSSISEYNRSSGEHLLRRPIVLLDLANCFESTIILQTCIELLHHIKSVTIASVALENKSSAKDQRSTPKSKENSIFDLNVHTQKQLRHYQYLTMQFTSSISKSGDFLRKIAVLTDSQVIEMKPFYQEFIIKILCFIPMVNTSIETVTELSIKKFWKIILHHLHDVLDNAVSLLSPEMFLTVTLGLLNHRVISIRKKSLELLNTKLQQTNTYFESCHEAKIKELIQFLAAIVEGIVSGTDDVNMDVEPTTVAIATEMVYVEQNALIALKLLSKMYGIQHLGVFKQTLGILTNCIKKRSHIRSILLATLILTLVEITSNLRAHSLSQVPNYMPLLIEVLQEQCANLQHNKQQPPDNVCIATVAGFQKLTEALLLFLGPYLVDIVTVLSCMHTTIMRNSNERHQRSINVLQRISAIWSKLASGVPLRVIVPCCSRAYDSLFKNNKHNEICVLMQLVGEVMGNAAVGDFNLIQKELTDFYMNAFEFREMVMNASPKTSGLSPKEISAIEMHIVDAFVIWVLKLSETSFRPIYQQMHHWAFDESMNGNGANKNRIITFFVLSKRIAESLKSLYILFASDVVDDAIKLLTGWEKSTKQAIVIKSNDNSDEELLRATLGTLHNVFLYDNKQFIKQRFNALLQPLVNQLENNLILEMEYLQDSLVACIAQFAAAIANDVQWKQLNYQVLLKTRNSVPEERILAFRVSVEIARKVGEDFTALLPETLPFIAELFEDDNARVEKSIRLLVQQLELIIGDSLQKYM